MSAVDRCDKKGPLSRHFANAVLDPCLRDYEWATRILPYLVTVKLQRAL